jgi:hypothetical protein
MGLSDFRIGWIKSKVESGLFLECQEAKKPPSLKAGKAGLVPVPPTIGDPFTECLQRDNGKNLELLESFLQIDSQHALAVVFWAELVQKKTIIQTVTAIDDESDKNNPELQAKKEKSELIEDVVSIIILKVRRR